LIMVCVDSFEEEMRIILNEHDQDEAEYQTMSYSERYIKHMVGH
jgi:hypothetical protein